MEAKIAADLRPSADGYAVRTSLDWPAVAKLQADSVPITMGQTDGQTSRGTSVSYQRQEATFPPFPTPLALEVGPLNQARLLGERCWLPQWGLGGARAEIEFGATILMTFLGIN